MTRCAWAYTPAEGAHPAWCAGLHGQPWQGARQCCGARLGLPVYEQRDQVHRHQARRSLVSIVTDEHALQALTVSSGCISCRLGGPHRSKPDFIWLTNALGTGTRGEIVLCAIL